MVEEPLIQVSCSLISETNFGMLIMISVLIKENLNRFTKERLAKRDRFLASEKLPIA